jgi:hypothetical protein
MASSSKGKLTLSIDKSILKDVKNVCENKNIPISRMVETYLRFVSDPNLWCFRCGEEFASSKAQVCPKCSYIICTKCRACGCKLDKETSIAVFHMRRVYEHLLGGRIK